MRVSLPLLLCAALTVTGCARVSQSNLNPLNWFGNSKSVVASDPSQRRPLVTEDRATRVVDSRGAIDQVTSLVIEKTPDGALIRATGVASTQGQFNAQLVPISNTGGTMTFGFRIEAASGFQGTNSAFSRQVTVARFVSLRDLAGVGTIVVQGASNARSAAR